MEELDLKGALERMDGDQELLLELSRMFLEGAPASLAKLREACRQGDAHSLEYVAHSVKGSALNLGAVALGETAGRLEALGREQAVEPAVSLVDDLDSQVHRFAEAVAALARGTRAPEPAQPP